MTAIKWGADEAWTHAILATAAISILPTIVLPFIPSRICKPGSGPLKIMLAFAVGGMLGDVFLHILPHLMSGSHSHTHSPPSSSDPFAGSHDSMLPLEDLQEEKPRSCPFHKSTEGDHGHDHDPEHNHHHEHGLHTEHIHMHMDVHAHGNVHPHSHTDHHSSSGDDIQHIHTHGDTHAHEIGGGPGGVGHFDFSHVIEECSVGLSILVGIILFFAVERLIRSIVGTDEPHSHGHGNHDNDVGKRKKNDDLSKENNGSAEKKDAEKEAPALKIGGLLNLAADFMHNVTDGIAIGAAYSLAQPLGIATTVATLFHELPHEIGDFAVLVQSGLSPWKAIGVQFVTALGAFAGVIFGLTSSRWEGAERILLGITAGGFIYVACAAVLPEILTSSSGLCQTIGEIIAIGVGVFLMVMVIAIEGPSH